MATQPIDASPFFRCLICRERVEVHEVCSEQYNPEYVVFCSCGLSYAPGVTSVEELLNRWNKGLIRNVEYKPFSLRVWLKQKINGNSTQLNKE
jgi:hypothetical protein